MAEGVRSTKDMILVAELLAGKTVAEAAAAAGESDRNARRRLADETFRAQLDEGRREIVAAVVARLAGAADRAVSTLVELLSEPTPAAVRRNAAKDLLAHLAELGETQDVARRLAALEETLERVYAGPRAVA
jgi:hypothetical protein